MTVAVLGTGLMGRAIAERLVSCGHQVIAYNRTRDKSLPLARLGIEVASTPAEAVSRSRHILLMLADATAIRAVLFDRSVLDKVRGRTVVQMGTIAPDESRLFERGIQVAGGDYAEAPVLGSLTEARNGRLLVMVGGTAAQVAGMKSWLACLGPEPELVGPVGQAAALKLALNQLIAAHIASFSLSLGYLQRSGVSVEAFRRLLAQSALAPPMFEKKYPRLAGRDYAAPNFSVRHLLKDVTLFLREADRAGLDRRSLEGIPGLLERSIALDHGDDDYAAIFEAINPAR